MALDEIGKYMAAVVDIQWDYLSGNGCSGGIWISKGDYKGANVYTEQHRGP